jgi:secreted PhoX family phosphatase
MGRFFREAATADPNLEVVYQTEDLSDGALYRFVPDRWGDLSAGELQVLVDDGGDLVWRVVPDPSASSTHTRNQVPGTVRFNGGEGAWLEQGKLLFATKNDNRIWSYDPIASELDIIYDVSTSPNPILSGVDNVTGLPSGGVIVAEDGGDMQLVALGRDGTTEALCQLTGPAASGSELTGPAVDASGTRLYVSSQRSPGRTYVIEGPFSDLIMPMTP